MEDVLYVQLSIVKIAQIVLKEPAQNANQVLFWMKNLMNADALFHKVQIDMVFVNLVSLKIVLNAINLHTPVQYVKLPS